jgi:hypothetical protein
VAAAGARSAFKVISHHASASVAGLSSPKQQVEHIFADSVQDLPASHNDHRSRRNIKSGNDFSMLMAADSTTSKRYPMRDLPCKLKRRVVLSSMLLLSALGSPAANAGECLITGPHYQLQSDVVEWQLKTRIGQSCIRGVRFKNVVDPVIKVISAPRLGKLTLLGPAFSYTAGLDGADEDSFSIEVSGFVIGGRGTSIIHVAVSIIGNPPMPSQVGSDSPNGASSAGQGVVTPPLTVDERASDRR